MYITQEFNHLRYTLQLPSTEESANGCMPQHPIDLSPITIVSQKSPPPPPSPLPHPILAQFPVGVKVYSNEHPPQSELPVANETYL